MLPPKIRPRYLPTLTHVVTSAELAANESPASLESGRSDSVDHEQMVQQIVQSLMPKVKARIQESLREILEDKLHHSEANMQLEMEAMVRLAMIEFRDSSNGS